VANNLKKYLMVSEEALINLGLSSFIQLSLSAKKTQLVLLEFKRGYKPVETVLVKNDMKEN
jgi:hypothetical protein